MQKKQPIKINFWLILIYFLLVITGLMTLYSANSADHYTSILQSRFFKQVLWVIISIITSIVIISVVKPFDLFNIIPAFFIAMVFLSIGVAIAGVAVHGSRSWFHLGPFSFQPAEVLKLATALFFARIIAKNKDSLYTLKTLFLSFLPVIIALITVVLQGDMGTALVFLSFIIPAYRFGLLNGYVVLYSILYGIVFFLSLKYPSSLIIQLIIYLVYMLSLSSIEKKFRKEIIIIFFSTIVGVHFVNVIINRLFPIQYTMIISVIIGTIIFLIMIFTKTRVLAKYLLVFSLSVGLFGIYILSPIMYSKLKPHQRERIEYFINPKSLSNVSSAEQGVGYNIVQAKLSISAGGFTGRGYLKGTHNKLKYVPAQDTDYIFCTVAEEFGFVGNIVVFLLFFALFYTIVNISERQQSLFSKVYGYSVMGIFFFHFAINIGSTLSLLPVIGIPLPFFSYGGSATFNFSLMLAILLLLDNYRNLNIEDVY